jgi:endonuclease YncB( thermonuclease family)
MKSTVIIESSYKKLLQEIVQNMQKTNESITRSKVEMCWTIGKLVEEHLQQNSLASYGNNLIKQLEKDAQISRAGLYRMRNFYQSYPQLPDNDPQLNWSHYKILSQAEDKTQRKYLENLIKKKGLSVSELANQVQKVNVEKTIEQSVELSFKRGQLFTYPVIEVGSKKMIDLGFHIFQKYDGKFEKGDILESFASSHLPTKVSSSSLIKDAVARLDVNKAQTIAEEQFSFAKTTRAKKKMHTYKAFVQKVVDGDTLNVVVDLGFNIFHKEIIRLAKINAPEKGTPAGEKATKKLKDILSGVDNLVIRTNKTDIYGRYVADIFLENEEGKYLNQMLLDCGVVVAFS